MKFSNEAMRDVLLFIESNAKYGTHERNFGEEKTTYNLPMILNDPYFSRPIKEQRYSKDELQYTIEKMVEGHLLIAEGNTKTYLRIIDTSYDGIQLLNAIRSPSIWAKTKKITTKIGNSTLDMIKSVAQKLAIEGLEIVLSNINFTDM